MELQMMRPDENQAVLSFSPTFNSYSSNKLAEIAARVVEEFNQDSRSNADVYGPETESHIFPFQENSSEFLTQEPERISQRDDNDDKGDEEFEFAFVSSRESGASTISADEIFYNGQIRTMYPIFNMDLLLADSKNDDKLTKTKTTAAVRRLPLRMLMSEDRETTSNSSSESDELEGVSPETYCVWAPKSAEASPESCKKSNSTGSSKKWRFRDLLYRSNSVGKEPDVVLFMTQSNEKADDASNVSAASGGEAVSDNQTNSGRDRIVKESDKKSYLHQRHDLVGIFANVNTMSRNLHPF